VPLAQHMAVSLRLTVTRAFYVSGVYAANCPVGQSPKIQRIRAGEPQADRKVLRQRRPCMFPHKATVYRTPSRR
jgi:hypothetical protein